MEAIAPTVARQRCRVVVRGIVQGVGFRPFVYRLARELDLDGWVRNDGAGVTIEAVGDAGAIAALLRRLRDDAPPLARVDSVSRDDSGTASPGALRTGFAVVDSERGPATTAVGPDAATCPDCLEELLAPADRRYRYAFINCTHCGPRYTITRELPYDRASTSMAGFALCPDCRREYASPLDRRFHAEPNACPVCGPRLALVDAQGRALTDGDPVAATVARLLRGEIVAVKGLGGFHLACDARNAAAVAALRRRKAREEKPFAVMVAGRASLAPLAEVDSAEAALLQSRERPIVLLRKCSETDALLPGVAPGLAWLGAMLPATPLQVLLFHEAAGRPPGTAWMEAPQSLVLVMTSANPGGEPLVTANDEALARLAGIADAWLLHDRDIVIRCDDSVLRALPAAQFVRRARGYTPRAIRLPRAGPAVVATGGHFKNTVCVTRGDEAFVSEHVGDLDNAATCAALEDSVAHLVAILDVEPAAVAHDLHPDFFSTRLAVRLAAQWRVPALAVQHHHAHVAAVVAERRLDGAVLGLALDGVGLGSDGAAWGGELLRVDGARCERLGRLRPLRLPGGDRAAREPWRMAAAAFHLAGDGARIARRFADEPGAATVAALLDRGFNAPETSSLGRWFDAAAGVLDVRRRMAFEGQAAMLLEGLAASHGAVPPERSLYAIDAANELDLLPLVLRIAERGDPGWGAAVFHATLACALAEWVERAAAARQVRAIAAAGGCMLNAVLAAALRRELAARGLGLHEAGAVPPNDGGLALGQAWVALQMLKTP
ncbi:MAG: carbamoyltransferase HypF [Betaproteobacteria bacterium]|nr:carbamoyltransferase HypF [Betaproteobacteria bacterium]